MAQTRRWPAWMTIVAIVILVPLLIWVLAVTLSLVAALSIGGLIVVAVFVLAFLWARRRVEQG